MGPAHVLIRGDTHCCFFQKLPLRKVDSVSMSAELKPHLFCFPPRSALGEVSLWRSVRESSE